MKPTRYWREPKAKKRVGPPKRRDPYVREKVRTFDEIRELINSEPIRDQPVAE